MATWSVTPLVELGPAERIDAEYYDPRLLGLEKEVMSCGLDVRALGSLFLEGYRVVYENTEIVPAPDDVTAHVRFLQAANVSNRLPVLKAEGVGWVSRDDWDRYPKGRITAGEILIEVKGKAEKVALVPMDYPEETLVTGTLFKATVDEDQVDRRYVIAYLMSKYGRGLRSRCLTNTLIGYVSKPELYSIPVPVPSPDVQEQISQIVQQCLNEERESRRLYSQAENALHEALGRIGDVPERAYEATAQFVFSCDRLDAEYFQPAKWAAISVLDRQASGKVKDYFEHVVSLYDPLKAIDSTVRNFDLNDAFFPFLDESKAPMPGAALGSTKKQFEARDVLISRLRSYLHQVAVCLTEDAILNVGSTEFLVLRQQDSTRRAISSETLLLYLRSAPVQTILRWSQDGSNHPRFDAKVVLDLPVPKRLLAHDKHLAELIRESIQLLRSSEASLRRALEAVERLIGGSSGDGRAA